MPRAGEIVDSDLDEKDPDSIHFAHLHPDDGRALRYHFDEFMVGWIAGLAAELMQGADLMAWNDYFGDGLLGLFVEQALYLELLQPARALFRRDFASRMGWVWIKPVRVIPELAALVKAHWPGPAAETVVNSHLLAGMRSLARFRRSILNSSQLVLRQGTHRQRWERPMIGVELGEGLDPAGKNDAFWMVGGAVDPSRVIFIVERHNLPFLDVPKSVQYAKSVGASVVTTDAVLAYKLRLPYWEPAWDSAGHPDMLPIGGLGADSGASRWLQRTLREARSRIRYWAGFFEDHNIAAYQHFTEMRTETVLRRVAARRANAIEFGRMRSQFFERHGAAFFFQHQVVMVWNRDVAEVLAASRTRTEFVVETGYPYDYMLSRGVTSVPEDRALRFAKEVSITCVVFDNHSHHDNHFTRQNLEAFYLAVISVAEQFPTLGLLVKSKKARILDALPDVKSRLLRLADLGRCVIVSEKGESAAANAIHADIAVGIPGSTAACEAALMGCSVLMFDPSGAGRFPDEAVRDVVCRDIAKFRERLEEHVRHPGDSLAQKNFRRMISPRAGGDAHVLAARFLNTYLDSRERGKDSRTSLNVANQLCQDYVVPVCSLKMIAGSGQTQ
jgi:hypothetical protein